jgi:cytochrome b pre-mRNA-processing protein 3
MILNLFRRTPREDTIVALYGVIVAQARHPAFYRFHDVPDTLNGRFEMLVLHAALLLSRLEAEGDAMRRLGQKVFDHFCSDMDANMREMGVGDMGVPPKMKAIGQAFYGRKRAYQIALAAPGLDELVEALKRNIYDGASAPGAARLAAYVRDAARQLATLERGALQSGGLAFPDPTGFADAPAAARGTK